MSDQTAEIEKDSAFLDEYQALCKKYDRFICDCGCCNSPWIQQLANEKELTDHIDHMKWWLIAKMENSDV